MVFSGGGGGKDGEGDRRGCRLEKGTASFGLGGGGKVGDGDLIGVILGETSLDADEGVVEPEGGGGGGGGGDVPLLSARKKDRFFLSTFGGSNVSINEGAEGFPPDRECRLFKGIGGRS